MFLAAYREGIGAWNKGRFCTLAPSGSRGFLGGMSYTTEGAIAADIRAFEERLDLLLGMLGSIQTRDWSAES